MPRRLQSNDICPSLCCQSISLRLTVTLEMTFTQPFYIRRMSTFFRTNMQFSICPYKMHFVVTSLLVPPTQLDPHRFACFDISKLCVLSSLRKEHNSRIALFSLQPNVYMHVFVLQRFLRMFPRIHICIYPCYNISCICCEVLIADRTIMLFDIYLFIV